MMFLVHRGDVVSGRGQSHRHVLAEAEGAVVPTVAFHGPHGQVTPLRELRGDQPSDERRVDPGAAVDVALLVHLRSMRSSTPPMQDHSHEPLAPTRSTAKPEGCQRSAEPASASGFLAVSYTHLTLPTKRIV